MKVRLPSHDGHKENTDIDVLTITKIPHFSATSPVNTAITILPFSQKESGRSIGKFASDVGRNNRISDPILILFFVQNFPQFL